MNVAAEASYLSEWEGLLPGQCTPAWCVRAGEGRTLWRVDGSLLEESAWRGETRHGTMRRYHEDGSLGSVIEYTDGVVTAATYHRTDNPTTEPNFDDLSPLVRTVINEYDTEGMHLRQTYRTGGGAAVDATGEPIPPLPVGVPAQAVYSSTEGRWMTARSWNGRRSGLARYWSPEGKPTRVEYYRDGSGDVAVDWRARFRGNPLIEAARDGDAVAVEICLEVGLGASPGAALHAAYEGLPELALRLLRTAPEPGELVDPRTEPDRPDTLVDGAVWVAGMGEWIRGDLDGATGAATGTWQLCDFNGWPAEADFVAGRRTTRREYSRRRDRLRDEYEYAADGTQTLWRTFDRGIREREIENRPDGAEARRQFDRDGALMFERVERDDTLVVERWYTPDGVLAAEVSPTDDSEVEWWRAVDAGGALIAEGPLESGRMGSPIGTWRLATGEKVEINWLGPSRSADLGRLAVALHAWQSAPVPQSLAGVDEVEWSMFDTFFGNAKHFPFLLKGLATPDELVFTTALSHLRDPILHQNTISGIAGPAVRFMTALVRDAYHPEPVMEFLVQIATRGGSLGAAYRLKTVYARTPTDTPDAERHYREHDTEDAYHEVYHSLNAAVPTWIELAANGAAPVRRWAAHLLAVAHGTAASDMLRQRLTVEPDPGTRAEILAALALHEPDPETLGPYLTSADPVQRFCAALTWVRRAITPTEPGVRVLLDALLERLDLTGFGAVYLGSGNARGDAATTLTLLPPEQATRYLTDLCQALGEADATNAVPIAQALLDVVYPSRGYTEGDELTDTQRIVIQAVADSPNAWQCTVDLHEVLRYNGLPCDADALRALAGTAPATTG